MTFPTRTRLRALALLLTLGISAAGLLAAPTAASAHPTRGPAIATATLRDASGASIGFALFIEGRHGVRTLVWARTLTPGLHGLHIHTTGECTPPVTSAGGHHNPAGVTHGSHSGDLPNLVDNGRGHGWANEVTTRATLSPGPTSVFDADGSALVIHAGPDDLVTDPTGNSGARVACGVIEQR